MKVTKRSMLTGKLHTMDINVTERQLKSYERGEGLLQDIFSHLTPDEREFIKSGITNEEFESTFQTHE
jgi:hypothetical protein